MKTQETNKLENSIRNLTRKTGVYGCYEVTIGKAGRVDYITYGTGRIWRCYEIKASKQDFHSSALHTFPGHYNYYVMPESLYGQVKDKIPEHVGVYTESRCIKKPRKQELGINEGILLDSMIRSLYRDSDKLHLSGSGGLEKLRRENAGLRRKAGEAERKYAALCHAAIGKYGSREIRNLLQGGE